MNLHCSRIKDFSSAVADQWKRSLANAKVMLDLKKLSLKYIMAEDQLKSEVSEKEKATSESKEKKKSDSRMEKLRLAFRDMSEGSLMRLECMEVSEVVKLNQTKRALYYVLAEMKQTMKNIRKTKLYKWVLLRNTFRLLKKNLREIISVINNSEQVVKTNSDNVEKVD